MRPSLALLAGLSLAIVAAACSGDDDDDDDGALVLTSGQYLYTATGVTADSCWEGDENVPPPGLTATIDVIGSETGVTLAAVDTGGQFLIPRTAAGVIDGDAFEGTFGPDVLIHLTSACSILRGGSFTGDITAEDAFGLATVYAFGVAVLNSNGTASNCADGPEDLYGLPFPAALRTNGTCGFGLNGSAELL